MSTTWKASLIADYGIDVTTPSGAARHLRSVGGASPLRLAPIADALEYGRIVRLVRDGSAQPYAGVPGHGARLLRRIPGAGRGRPGVGLSPALSI